MSTKSLQISKKRLLEKNLAIVKMVPYIVIMEPNHKLRYLRMKNKLTQGDLAQKLGITRQYMSQLETGACVPGRKLAVDILNLTAGWDDPIQMQEWWVNNA